MIKLLHISDTHMGNRQYKSDLRKNDFMDAFEESIDIAINNNVDAVFHTGDLFDNPNPDVSTVNKTLDVLIKLKEEDIDFYTIVGNHERKREDQWVDLMDRLSSVNRLDKTPEVIGNGEEEVGLYGIDAVRKPEWDNTSFELKEFNEERCNILCMHELVHPPVPEHMADHELDSILDRTNNIDILALGDYHEISESKKKGVQVYYPGSTEKTSMNESDDHKVFLLTIDEENFKKEGISLDSPRDFMEVEFMFNEQDGIGFVENEIEKYSFSIEKKDKSPVLIAKLKGKVTGVSPNEVKTVLEKNGIEIVRIKDQRNNISEDFEESEITSSTIENKIDEKLDELELSNFSEKIDSLIRDEDISKNKIRNKTKEKFDKDYLNKGDNK